MPNYKELAPLIFSTGITRQQIENYFEGLDEVFDITVEPKITKLKVQALADKYFSKNGIEVNGGLLRISNDIGLTVMQTKAILEEMKKLFDIWNQL